MSGPGAGKTNNPMGRPKGAKSRWARENIEAARASGDARLPHEILLSFARGEAQYVRTMNPQTKEITIHTVFPDLDQQQSAANMAAPYFAPKLAQVQHKGSIARSADQVSDEDLIKVALPTGDGDE